ncbi:MAG: hypothetical protein DWQ09_17680 [Proteobacteria bacterium]|nr:MAG: hypothetical protein DWQ09_17680 [Pseudomonadota bacterium]QKK11993.1 MAG: hypothetical protein HND59_10760 [Pseudomonadota bacterium]
MRQILRIPIDDVTEGAELAADLLDDKGRMLMKQGTELTAEKLSALRRRNVEMVSVLAENEMDAAEIETRRLEIVERVEARFERHRDNDLMQRFKAVVIDYRGEVLR